MKFNKIVYVFLYCRRFVRKMGADHVSAYSAQSAFFIFLSFFPFVMLLASLLMYLPFGYDELTAFIEGFLSPSVSEYVSSIISEVYAKSSGAVISITTLIALWSAARGLLAVMRGLNCVYGIEEKRGYIRLRLSMALYTLVVIVLLIVSLGILVFGGTIKARITANFPDTSSFFLLILNLRWLVALILLTVVFDFMFTFMPKRKTTLRAELPGAFVAALGWLVFSALYSVYIEHFANFSYFYGSLATLVLLMLWIYFCMYILFFGAEVNVALADNTFMPEVKLWVKRKRRDWDIWRILTKQKIEEKKK